MKSISVAVQWTDGWGHKPIAIYGRKVKKMSKPKSMNILEFIDAMMEMGNSEEYASQIADSITHDGKFDKIEAYQVYLTYFIDWEG